MNIQGTQADDERIVTRKQKSELNAHEGETSPKKKAKSEKNDDKKSTESVAMEFDKFCKATKEYLTTEEMRRILEANGQEPTDDAVVPTCQDIMFYGPMDKCSVCGGTVICDGKVYKCNGEYSEWSSCAYTTRDPPRKDVPLNIPESVQNSKAYDFIKRHQDPKNRPKRELELTDKPFYGMTISLLGRLSRRHQRWKSEIEKHGGKVSNSVIGVTCLVASAAERDRGGTGKLAEALERDVRVVREEWLTDCIEKKEPQPLEAYDIASDLVVGGKGIPLDKQDPSDEALETIAAEVNIFGKRGVHKDTKLQDEGGKILEKDGIKYNCAFSVCNLGRKMNNFCVTQLITVPEKPLNMYRKQGRIGDISQIDEKLEEWDNVDDAIKEFARLFGELTGNEFEPWEREKQIKKKLHKFMPIDMDEGVDVRHGGLALRQKGVAVAHTKLDPKVGNFMKVLCSQEIYRYALMEMGLDFPEMPIGMVTDIHLKRCEDILLQFVGKLKTTATRGPKDVAYWDDFSSRWFTLLPSTRPFKFRNIGDIAEHGVSVFESVRDINVASRLIGDMSGSTLDDPLFDRYRRLGCYLSPLEKDSDDYKMIEKYLQTTYEPFQVGEIGYSATIMDIFEAEVSACPSYEEVKRLPNKVLLWCGTRTSNLLRHLHKGFLPSTCQLPVPGYMFGKAIVCSDAAAEAARYGFTAVDRPEGVLVLAVASLGEKITEISSPPEDTREFEEKKMGIIGRGKRKTNESEHFTWKDDIKVPCGRLIESEHKDSILDYDEYAIYDPHQVCIKFLVSVKYEEMDVEYDVAE